MEEAVKPDFDNMQLFKSRDTICGSSGASVSKPMDRRVGYGTLPVKNATPNESVEKATPVMVRGSTALGSSKYDINISVVIWPAHDISNHAPDCYIKRAGLVLVAGSVLTVPGLHVCQ